MQTDKLTQTLEPSLAEHPFIKNLNPEYQHLLTECASNVRFDAGDYIFRENDPAEKLYLIRYGKVAVQFFTPNRGPVVIQTLQAGDALGWSWLIPPYKWHFDARAMELTRAIALDGNCLKKKCHEDPMLGFAFMERISGLLLQRLQATRLQLLEAYDDQMA